MAKAETFLFLIEITLSQLHKIIFWPISIFFIRDVINRFFASSEFGDAVFFDFNRIKNIILLNQQINFNFIFVAIKINRWLLEGFAQVQLKHTSRS